MYFIDPEGNYPRHVGDLQLQHPEWSVDNDKLPEGWIEVTEGILPEIPKGFALIELQPKKINEKYVRQFDLVAVPIELIENA